VDLALEQFAPRAQVFAVYGDLDIHTMEGRFDRAVSALTDLCRENKTLAFCRSAEEVRKAARKGQTAALLSVEGAEVLNCSPERLEQAAKQGLIMTGITWNHANLLSGSCVEAPERGLTELGRQYVQTATRLGVALDISHLSPKGAQQVIELASGRVLASHSNAYSLCPHPRNLTDDQFRALALSGGVTGINLYTPFLTEDDRKIRSNQTEALASVIAHIRHFVSLTPLGTKPIVLGCDFDGCDLLPAGLTKSKDMGKLYFALLDAGFTKQEVDGIFYENLLRFLQQSGKA
jgi:membrane dipeptidase